MLLSVSEAARILGKPERTVRHMIRTGRLPAHRDGARWRIDRDALQPHEPAPERPAQMAALREHVNDALDRATPRSPAKPARYSVRDLDAFTLLTELIHGVDGIHPPAPDLADARTALKSALHAVADGCHQFHADHKRRRFIEARSHAAAAASDLFLAGAPAAVELGARIEAEVLPRIRGLVRRAEKAS